MASMSCQCHKAFLPVPHSWWTKVGKYSVVGSIENIVSWYTCRLIIALWVLMVQDREGCWGLLALTETLTMMKIAIVWSSPVMADSFRATVSGPSSWIYTQAYQSHQTLHLNCTLSGMRASLLCRVVQWLLSLCPYLWCSACIYFTYWYHTTKGGITTVHYSVCLFF